MYKKVIILFVMILFSALAVSACGGRPVKIEDPNFISTQSMHGDSGYSYDGQGNLIDTQGNLVFNKDDVMVSSEVAQAIVLDYAKVKFTIDDDIKVRNVLLMYEHGIVEQKVELMVNDKPFVMNVDARTGDLYSQGCMGGPNPKKVVAYYDAEKYENLKLTGAVIGEQEAKITYLDVDEKGFVNPEDVRKEITVDLRNTELEPSIIVLKRGEPASITFINHDGQTHGFSVPELNLVGLIEPGESKTFEIQTDKAGEFDFYCAIYCGEKHYNMGGTIIISDNPDKVELDNNMDAGSSGFNSLQLFILIVGLFIFVSVLVSGILYYKVKKRKSHLQIKI